MLRRLLQVQQNGFSVDIGGTLGAAWELIKPQLGILVLFNLVAIIGCCVIPFAGIIALPFMTVANFHVFRQHEKGKKIEFATFFEVFSHPNFWNTVIAYLIQNLILTGIVLGLLLLFGGIGAAVAFGTGVDLEHNTGAALPFVIYVLLASLFFAVIMMYLTVAYSFVIPSVFYANDGTGWWELIENSRKAATKNWGGLLLFHIIQGFLLNLLIIFTLCLGFFIVIPLAMGVQYILFRNTIGFDEDDTTEKDITEHFVL
jgi:hypothetical protein